jgi:hypothetical protein
VFVPDLESILRARKLKILLQQYLPEAAVSNRSTQHLFDHLVGAGEQRWLNVKTERFGSLEIDRKLVLGRRLHRKVGRSLAFENAINVTSSALKSGDQPCREKVGGLMWGRPMDGRSTSGANGMWRGERLFTLGDKAAREIA